MSKQHFDGIYNSVIRIPPKQLLSYFLMGNRQERLEAEKEIIRRLEKYDEIRSFAREIADK